MRCRAIVRALPGDESSSSGSLVEENPCGRTVFFSRSAASSSLNNLISSAIFRMIESRFESSVSLITGLQATFLHLSAYLNVECVSLPSSADGDTVATMVVRALPPNESLNKCVRVESL